MLEHYFNCPYYWQTISMLLDTSITFQDYIEDCEVCCNPIKLKLNIKNEEIISFVALSIGQ